ncbi:MAG: DNA methyltransferase, partial [Anaerolineae bacterium]|nr:DNA methyltransferase [Anaerolineae bacterium]
MKTGGKAAAHLDIVADYLLWYGRDNSTLKFRQLFDYRSTQTLESQYNWLELPNGHRTKIRNGQELHLGKRFRLSPLFSQSGGPTTAFCYEYQGKVWSRAENNYWKTTVEGLDRLARAHRLIGVGRLLWYVRYAEDFPVVPIANLWTDTAQAFQTRVYVVQTNTKVLERCVLMTTDPGDLVLDPTCGSGTTAYVAEQWGRRWITCDTSRVAITLARQRLMTAVYDYYELAQPHEGVGSGFVYKTVPHVTLKSIANNPDIREGMTRAEIDAAILRHAPQETLYDQPLVDRKKVRVSGPFTVEAVPALTVRSPDEIVAGQRPAADDSVARSGETLRQAEWRDELLRTGIRGKNGQYIRFARLEPLPGLHHLHADGETRPSAEGADSVKEAGTAYSPQRVVVSFGPVHAPLEQRQVGLAIEEAQTLVPRPRLIVFAAFQFDPEAAKDIDETKWPGVTLLKVQMNADLLTEDLKKKRASNESFWLIGQPDVQVERIAEGEHSGKHRVSVHGFDYYNTKTGDIESGSAQQIAVWLLDTDYDGRSLYPRQVFF